MPYNASLGVARQGTWQASVAELVNPSCLWLSVLRLRMPHCMAGTPEDASGNQKDFVSWASGLPVGGGADAARPCVASRRGSNLQRTLGSGGCGCVRALGVVQHQLLALRVSPVVNAALRHAATACLSSRRDASLHAALTS